MSKPMAPIHDLKNNYDITFWSNMLDQQEYQLTELHKKINWEKYMEWGLTALKAQKEDEAAKSILPTILSDDNETKKIIDEMALSYLIQPIIRHFLFRATNKSKEVNDSSTGEI